MKTVMIVDDSELMRNTVKGTFKNVKIPTTILEAGDGEDAMEVLKSNKVDLILLDWNMPNLSGIGFLKQMRAIDEYKEIPVIMITSEASKLNVVEAIKAGVSAYITKPVNSNILFEKISQFLI
ncbi:MAG: response regulator [Treponema sp.]|jgi:two-component system chemotaxis response regulator CheY|nr:response regulator [Treponema sp.]